MLQREGHLWGAWLNPQAPWMDGLGHPLHQDASGEARNGQKNIIRTWLVVSSVDWFAASKGQCTGNHCFRSTYRDVLASLKAIHLSIKPMKVHCFPIFHRWIFEAMKELTLENPHLQKKLSGGISLAGAFPIGLRWWFRGEVVTCHFFMCIASDS